MRLYDVNPEIRGVLNSKEIFREDLRRIKTEIGLAGDAIFGARLFEAALDGDVDFIQDQATEFLISELLKSPVEDKLQSLFSRELVKALEPHGTNLRNISFYNAVGGYFAGEIANGVVEFTTEVTNWVIDLAVEALVDAFGIISAISNKEFSKMTSGMLGWIWFYLDNVKRGF